MPKLISYIKQLETTVLDIRVTMRFEEILGILSTFEILLRKIHSLTLGAAHFVSSHSESSWLMQERQL